jgi:hypothetical protein
MKRNHSIQNITSNNKKKGIDAQLIQDAKIELEGKLKPQSNSRKTQSTKEQYEGKPLDYKIISNKVKEAKYAVRGELAIRAEQIKQVTMRKERKKYKLISFQIK